jgi:hypothetical protein
LHPPPPAYEQQTLCEILPESSADSPQPPQDTLPVMVSVINNGAAKRSSMVKGRPIAQVTPVAGVSINAIFVFIVFNFKLLIKFAV